MACFVHCRAISQKRRRGVGCKAYRFNEQIRCRGPRRRVGEKLLPLRLPVPGACLRLGTVHRASRDGGSHTLAALRSNACVSWVSLNTDQDPCEPAACLALRAWLSQLARAVFVAPTEICTQHTLGRSCAGPLVRCGSGAVDRGDDAVGSQVYSLRCRGRAGISSDSQFVSPTRARFVVRERQATGRHRSHCFELCRAQLG